MLPLAKPRVFVIIPGVIEKTFGETVYQSLPHVKFVRVGTINPGAVITAALALGRHVVMHKWGMTLTELQELGIPYSLIYPHPDRLNEFRNLAAQDPSSKWFEEWSGQWNLAIDECFRDSTAELKVCLEEGEFLPRTYFGQTFYVAPEPETVEGVLLEQRITDILASKFAADGGTYQISSFFISPQVARAAIKQILAANRRLELEEHRG